MRAVVLSMLLAVSVVASAASDTSVRYLGAKHMLVETNGIVMWYCCFGGGDFERLRSIVGEAFAQASGPGEDSGRSLFTIRVVGEDLDDQLVVSSTRISNGRETVAIDGATAEVLEEMVTSRFNYGRQAVPGVKRASELSHEQVMELSH